MRRWIAGILASFVGIGAACGGTTEGTPVADAGADTGAEPLTDAAADRAIADGRVAPMVCPAPSTAPPCTGGEKPAPSARAAISSFLTEIAVPIRCESEGRAAWDPRALVDLYGDRKIFMVGEVHGSNEIGIVSSVLFEELARRDLVNVVAFELPMDFEAPIQSYVDTGSDPVAEQIIGYLAPNMFGSILPETARKAAAAGKKIVVGAVDVPQNPDFPAAIVRSLAQKLTTRKAAILDALPAAYGEPPTAAELARTTTLFDTVTANRSEICAELTAAECDRFVAMTYATWVSAYAYDETVGQSEEWFSRREEVIYFNMKQKVASESDRMFLHMGAFHTNKHALSAGSRMASEYPLTKGKVFSVAPAFGDGSVIWYGEDQRLSGDPAIVPAALGDVPKDPAFVSTTRNDAACAENPLGLQNDDAVIGFGKRRDLYDGYIHYGKLTSESRPKDATLTRDLPVVGRATADTSGKARAFLAYRARVERAEAKALSHRLERAKRR